MLSEVVTAVVELGKVSGDVVAQPGLENSEMELGEEAGEVVELSEVVTGPVELDEDAGPLAKWYCCPSLTDPK